MHPYPLRSIGVENFKSIADGEVELLPLTVLVGTNSVGKSSLLQAIRFLSQTAKAHEIGAEVPLNGTKVRLGTFDDARTAGADGPISFQATVANPAHNHAGDDVAPEALLTLDVEEPAAKPDRGYAQIAVNRIEVSDAAVVYLAEKWLDVIWADVEATWIGVWDADLVGDPYMWDDTEQLLEALEDAADAEQASSHQASSHIDRSLVLAGVNDIRRAIAGADLPTHEEFLGDLWKSASRIENEAAQAAIVDVLIGRLFAPIPESPDEVVLELPDEVVRAAFVELIGVELAELFSEHAPGLLT